jgi:hypothetical protein
MNRKIRRHDLYIIAIFIVMAVAVMTKSYFHSDGYLSADSSNYLKLALNLRDGKGYYTSPCDYSGRTGKVFFSYWPVGYPTMIFFVTKALGISAFWASKCLNLIMIGLGMLLLRKVSKENAYVYAMIFLLASFIEVYSYTWSEAAFIFGMLWFAYAIHSYLVKSSNTSLINIFLASVFLFLTRYIGLFSYPVIGLVGVYRFARRRYVECLKLFLVVMLGSIVVGLYFWHNYLETGYWNGIALHRREISIIGFVVGVLESQVIDLNLVLTRGSYGWLFWGSLILEVGIFLYFWRKAGWKIGLSEESGGDFWKTCIFVGMMYWIQLIAAVWGSIGMIPGFRYWAPSTFLFLLAGLNFCETRANRVMFARAKGFIFAMAILSFMLNVPTKIVKNNVFDAKPTYYRNIREIERKYRDVPAGSLVVLGNIHLNYLRSDIRIFYPAYDEVLEDFLARARGLPDERIYMEIPRERLDRTWFGDSVSEFFARQEGGVLMRLR